MKIAILGGGNMGGAFAHAFIEKKVCVAKDLLIVEPIEARRKELKKELRCRVQAEIDAALEDCSPIFLAVKPLEMLSVCGRLRSHVKAKQLVISILAGIRSESIIEALGGHDNLIRCMPNTSVQLGLGMSVYFPAPGVTQAGLKVAQKIFDAAGASFAVTNEELIDAATAISGSGPAYVYYFIEHYLQAAKKLGFSAEEAELLVGQTMAGALALWSASGETPAVLRERVTSKGGTTAAALSVFETRNLGQALVEGIERADARCRELQQESKAH